MHLRQCVFWNLEYPFPILRGAQFLSSSITFLASLANWRAEKRNSHGHCCLSSSPPQLNSGWDSQLLPPWQPGQLRGRGIKVAVGGSSAGYWPWESSTTFLIHMASWGVEGESWLWVLPPLFLHSSAGRQMAVISLACLTSWRVDENRWLWVASSFPSTLNWQAGRQARAWPGFFPWWGKGDYGGVQRR